MRMMLAIVAVIIAIGLSGCTNRATPDIGPTPTIARKYAVLPRSGSIVCDSGGDYVIWEFPGLTPGDLNSATYSYRGAAVGTLKPCTKVQIDDVAWSQWDKHFYLRVTFKSVHGWISEEYVEVTSSAGP